jgi:dGTPase
VVLGRESADGSPAENCFFSAQALPANQAAVDEAWETTNSHVVRYGVWFSHYFPAAHGRYPTFAKLARMARMIDTMMTLPITTTERETALLASYAMHSKASQGRVYPEREQDYRGPFQRDRDRILHAAAFRRLSGKMQVFTGDMGDYHRTRLTHTHEVASIARTLGRALRLNEDLVEALALFHDIGHPPFGHAGEDALSECLADEGGFSHNSFALTIAEELEHPYANFPGLNLTREVLEGQQTRSAKGRAELAPLLEAQVVEAADSATYNAHDCDDAMQLGLVVLEELCETALVRQAVHRIQERFVCDDADVMRRAVTRELLDLQVSDVLRTSANYLSSCEGRSADDVRRDRFRVVPSSEMLEKKLELERLLYERVYRHPRLLAMRSVKQHRIQQLFACYSERPELLPVPIQERAHWTGLARAVGDHIACLTDRSCDQQFLALVEGRTVR